ncbi:imelysin family protein [Thalassospira sp. TSL5-1]|uniref:imelysin family protein n=1 Tax=Thalassospira sp. TSL5-1 TaxID=1544451 RepID=UPI00093F58BD|nr:imelysin family protein [Thalassospira sp. TSL5-1]OKH89275.1 peptidase M75, Imelysin [Thalassospira sp. TSL5-1]
MPLLKTGPRRMLAGMIVTITTGFLAAPPAQADLPDEQYHDVIVHLLSNVMPPQLDALHKATSSLASDMPEFCKKPNQNGLDEMRKGFHAAMDRWQEVQPWRMGPMMAEGRDQLIEYWPDKHGTAARQFRLLLRNKPPLYTNPAKIGEASAALQGFPALEEVLFNPKLADEIVAADKDGAYLCQYGMAISANLEKLTGELVAEWPAFADAMMNAGPDSMDYPTAKFAATDLYRALHEGMLIIISQKLARPLGEGPDDANAKRAESWRSERSLRNISHNLKSLFAIYDGKLNGAGESGKGMVALIGADSLLDKSFRLNWQQIRDASDALPDSMVQVLAKPDGYEKIQDLENQVAYGVMLVENDIGGHTELGGGFNALDGD